MATYTTGVGEFDIELYAGDRNDYVFTFTADGQPWDMTGATVEAQARRRAGNPDAALTAVVTEIDAAAGKWRVEWPGDDVRNVIVLGNTWYGVWDCQVLEAGQIYPKTVMRGSVRAVMDVTR